MRRHTPGPWRINKFGWEMSIVGRVHQITNDEMFPAAFVPAWDRPENGETDGREEALANARLVAASPDMLADIVEAERMFRWYGDLHAAKPDPEKATRNYEMADRLAATISKATQ